MMTTSDERDILTLALTGTRYSGGAAAPQTTPPIDQLPLAEGRTEGEAERALLLRAGAWAIYRRAGYRPADAPEPPAPAPAETRPQCSSGAGEVIEEILRTRRFDLLPEALARLNASGLRLPPALLPMALSSVGLTLEMRVALVPALGERGHWLAGFNRAWAWAAERSDDVMDDPAHAQEVWETGRLGQRTAALRAMRHRDPAAARDLLAAEWTREQAKARATLVRALEINLSPEDAPLLDQALADRAEDVRSGAAELLFRLPTSSLAQTIRRLLEASLIFTGDSLSVQAPVALASADAATCDLLTAAFGSATPGTDALLHQLRYIPPEHWEEHFGQPAEALIKAAKGVRWGDEVVSGWMKATVHFGSTRWVQALWKGWLLPMASDLLPPPARLDTWIKTLTPLLPPEELLHSVMFALSMPTFYSQLPLSQILDCLPRPWSSDVTERFLNKLGEALDGWNTNASPAGPWINALSLAATALPSNQFARAREVCAIADDQHRNLTRWRYQLASFLASLDLRERVIKEIALP